MKRVEMDFYGQRIVVEYDGQENPVDFLTRKLAEAKTYAARERTRGNAYAALAKHLAKNGFDKPSQGSRETEAAFKKRLERWALTNERIREALESSAEAKSFMKAREAHIKGLAELDAAMANTYPDLDNHMRLGGNYSDGAKELPTLPSPWYSKVLKAEDGGLTKHVPFDLHSTLISRFMFGEEPD